MRLLDYAITVNTTMAPLLVDLILILCSKCAVNKLQYLVAYLLMEFCATPRIHILKNGLKLRSIKRRNELFLLKLVKKHFILRLKGRSIAHIVETDQ